MSLTTRARKVFLAKLRRKVRDREARKRAFRLAAKWVLSVRHLRSRNKWVADPGAPKPSWGLPERKPDVIYS